MLVMDNLLEFCFLMFKLNIFFICLYLLGIFCGIILVYFMILMMFLILRSGFNKLFKFMINNIYFLMVLLYI